MTGYKTEGLRCPNPGCPDPGGPFTVAAGTDLTLDSHGDVIDEEPPEYEDDTFCRCIKCSHHGSLIDFEAKPEDYIIYPRKEKRA